MPDTSSDLAVFTMFLWIKDEGGSTVPESVKTGVATTTAEGEEE